MEEAAPTNSMSGVYQQSPRANDAFRLGELDPPRRFVAAADGSWPAGIPGTAGEPYYDRPAGHWEGTVDWETITNPKFGYNAAQNNSTDGLIDPVTNAVKTQLPPNSRSFILGPLVDGFVPNHVGDAFTRIGYIEKDTRQFVLLGIIQGEWTAGLNEVITGFGGGSYPVWDGNALRFTQVNPNFTLDMALWFRNEMLKGRFVKNVSYNAVGGVPQLSNQDPNAPQPLGGNGVGGGSGEAGQNPDGTGTGTGEGGNPTQGNEQGDPDPGQDPGENDLWGMTKEELAGMSESELAENDPPLIKDPDTGDIREMTDDEKNEYDSRVLGLTPDQWNQIGQTIDAGMLALDVLAVIGTIFPDPIGTPAGAAYLAARFNNVRKAWKAWKTGKSAFDGFNTRKTQTGKTQTGKTQTGKTQTGKSPIENSTRRGKDFNVDNDTGVVRNDKGQPTFEPTFDGDGNQTGYQPVDPAHINRGRIRTGFGDDPNYGHPEYNPGGKYNTRTPVQVDSGKSSKVNTTKKGKDGFSFREWWNKGRNERIRNENDAPFGDIRDYFRKDSDINPNTLFGDDALQRGKSDINFETGKRGNPFGRPDQAFNPFRKSEKGGPGSGPTPAVRQSVERSFKGLKKIGGTDNLGKQLTQQQEKDIIKKTRVIEDRVVKNLKSDKEIDGLIKKAGEANEFIQKNEVASDRLDKVIQGAKSVRETADQIGQYLNTMKVAGTAFGKFLAHNAGVMKATENNPVRIPLPKQDAQNVSNTINQYLKDNKVPVDQWSNLPQKHLDGINDLVASGQQTNKSTITNKFRGEGGILRDEYHNTVGKIGRTDAFARHIKTDSKGNSYVAGIDDNYTFTDPQDALGGITAKLVEITNKSPFTRNRENSPYTYKNADGTEVPTGNMPSRWNLPAPNDAVVTKIQKGQGGKELGSTTRRGGVVKNSYELKGFDLTEDKLKILKEIKQPLKEIKELPKTEKLKGYRPNFKGKLSPQNTPDVTASKDSDRLVMAKNAEGQAWSVGDKYFKGWETTNRMNHVYSRVGESNKFFEQITANNKSDYDRKLQEHLNHLYHNKAMKLVDPDYVSPFDPIKEQETFDNKVNDPLFTKVAKRLKKEIDYEKKPAKAGYPNEAPPKIDPNTGMHPKYGKRYKYDKLDPISAKAMAGAPTGDPEIDANVKRQAQKEDWRSDLKNLWLGAERGDWKKKIEEGMTVSGAKVIKKVISGVGDVDLDILKLGLTGDGEIDPGPGQVWGRAFNQDPNNPSAIDSTDTRTVGPGGWQDGRRNDNTMVNPDSVYHMADTCRSTDEVDDPTDVGTGVRRFGSNSLVHISHGIGLNYKIPGIEFNLNHGLRNASVNGRHDFGHNRTFALHPPGPTDDTIGRGPGAAEYVDGQNVGGYGTALRFWGPNVPRLAALKGVDTTEIDSIKLHAAVASGACTHEGEQLQLWYWAGDMEGFKSYHDVKIGSFPKRAHDGWRPTFIKPDGTVADGVSNVIVPHDRSNLIGYESNKLYPFRVQIPEWCRGKNVRFMLYQHTHGAGSAGSGGASGWGVDNIYITSLRFQRHNSIAITGPLDSPEGSNFIRVGNNSNVSSQARIKELNKMLKAARKYMLKQLGFSSLFDSKGDPIVDITPANYYVGRNDYMSTMRKVNARLYDKEHGKGAHKALQKMRDSVGKPPTPKKYTSSRGSGRIRGYKITAKDSKGMTKRAVMYNEYDKEGKNLQEGMTTMALTGILPAAKGVDLTSIPSGSPDNDGNYTAFSIMGDITTAEDPTGVGCWFRHPDFDFGNPDRASIQSFHGGTYSGSESSDSGSGKEGQVAGYVPRAMRLVRPSGNWAEVGQPYQPVFGVTNDLIGTTSIGTALQFSQNGYMATKNIDTSDVDTLKIHAFVSSSSRIIASDKVELFYWAGNKTGFKSTWTGAAYSDGEGHESGHLKNNDGWRRINTKPDGTVDNTVQTKIIDHLRPNSNNGKLSAYTIHLPEWTRGKNSRFIITSFGSSSATFQMTSMRFQRNNAIKSPALTKSLTDIETSPFVRVGPTKKNEGGKQRKKKVQKIIDSGLEYTGTKFSKDFPVRTRLESKNLFQKIKNRKIIKD